VNGYDLAASGENDGLWDWNLTTNRIHFSPRWISMLGCEGTEVGNIPEEWFRRIHPEDLKRVKLEIDTLLEGNASQFENQHRMLHHDGTYRWMSCRGTVMEAEKGQAVHMAGSHKDITAEKVADALTGLPNRLLFLDRLTRSIEQTKRNNDFIFAVLLLNFDRFKSLVDRLGLTAADQVLIAAARRLETCLRTGNTVARLGQDHLVARPGRDEFIILLDGLNEVGEAKQIAERLLSAISAPFKFRGEEVYLSASIGIALSVTGYSRPEEALRDADTALHRAKSLGKARCEVFDTAILESAQTQIRLEADLQGALERQEFSVFYQPILSLASSQIAGFEALVRWRHPARGMVSPLEFIPIAERSGLIIPLGKWVLQEACRQLKAWQDDLGIPEDLFVSVNFSSLQFKQPFLVEQISKVLCETGIKPQCLMLELTESVVMENPQAVSSLLMQLRVIGVKIGLDDFGTGYSSLGYLRQFPVDYLKIDHSFVRRMETSKDLVDIVRTIGSLAHQLGLHVIAEGIENADQLKLIRSLSCEYGQGFLFSRPVDNENAEALLKADLLKRQGIEVEKEEGRRNTTEIKQSFQENALPVASGPFAEGPMIDRKLGKLWRGAKSHYIPWVALLLLLAGGFAVKYNRMTSPASGGRASGESAPPLQVAAMEPVSGETTPPPQVAAKEPANQEPAPAPKATSKSNAVRKSAPPKKIAAIGSASGESALPLQVAAEDPASGESASSLNATSKDNSGEGSALPQPLPKDPAPPAVESLAHTFPVIHRHILGSCKGILSVSQDALSFISDKEKDGFTFRYAEFSRECSDDYLTIKSGSKTYRFKSATARSKDDNRSQLREILQRISSSILGVELQKQ
jgi:diguanylate cyclase (GGDEF)-like protein/PAS domain S-box-containing protein